MTPSDISAMAHKLVGYARDENTHDALSLVEELFPAAHASEIARSCRYAVVIANDQGEFGVASALQPIVEEAQRRELAS
ncbi:MAG TPA: hypothetical protein VGN98_10955, partial [Tianweitania sediminis]|nr:hypothetical protein [Tianweitania sediminis]